MSSTSYRTGSTSETAAYPSQHVPDAGVAEQRVLTAAHQAFWVLRLGFTAAPIMFGLDKFFNWSVHWPDYLASWVNRIIPGTGQQLMYVVGAVEICAGLLVLF